MEIKRKCFAHIRSEALRTFARQQSAHRQRSDPSAMVGLFWVGQAPGGSSHLSLKLQGKACHHTIAAGETDEAE